MEGVLLAKIHNVHEAASSSREKGTTVGTGNQEWEAKAYLV